MFSSLLHSFGLDISDLSAKLIAIKSNLRNGRMIYAWAKCDFPEGTIVDGDIKQPEKAVEIIKAMMASLPALTTPYVTASLPESKTFMKVIEVENNNTLEASIMEELPNHIPIALDELIIDWRSAHEFDNRCMVTVGAIPKTIADSYTALLTACGLKPIAFEIEAQAIARSVIPCASPAPGARAQWERLTHRFSPRKKDSIASRQLPEDVQEVTAQLIVDLGATRSSMSIVDWSTIQFTSSVALSGVDATKQIASRLKLTFDEAERAKRICGLDAKKCKGVVNSVLEGLLNNLAMEIERAIDFYRTHFKRSHPVNDIIFTGGGANLVHAETLLSSQLSVPVRIGNPLINVLSGSTTNEFPKKETLSFSTAIGLALRDAIEIS